MNSGMRALVPLIGCLLLTAVLAGCGSDGEAGPGATKGPEDGGLSGKPIVVGAVYADSGPRPRPEFADGARAAARHINQDLGGVEGRPVELRFCELDASPEASTRCAHRLTREGVVAVVGSEDPGTDASLPIYEAAGVSYISNSAENDQMYVNPISVALGGGVPGYGAAFARFLVEVIDARKIVMVTPDAVPTAAVKQYFGGPVEQLGGSMQVIPYPVASPDVTATLAAAREAEPDAMVAVFETESACVQAIRAQQQLGMDVPTVQLECNEDSVFEQVGSAAEGMYFATGSDVGSGADTPSLNTYVDFMRRSAPDTDPGSDARWGAMTLMTLYGALTEVGAEPTRKRVLRRLKGADGGEVFLGGRYKCGQIEDLPSICFAQLRFAQYEGGERRSASDWIDAADLLQ